MGNFLELMNIFDQKQIDAFKNDFRDKFVKMCDDEKKYCAENKTFPMMDDKKKAIVINLLEKCGNAYHVEALRRFIIQECVIPEWEQVDMLANNLMTEACK
jgi:hypothetical protein